MVEGQTIAVDPRVIPYGTKVIIGGQIFTAEDCGGAIQGNHIDIYVNNHAETTHGGLECGILFGKKNDLDIISFGPELTGVHTYNERVHIESTKRMWDYLKELLKICK